MSSLQKDDDDDDDDEGERREKQKEEKIVVESSIRLMMMKMMMMKTMTTMMKGDDDRSQSSSRIEKSSVCKVRYKTSSKTPAIVSRFLSSRHGSGVLLSTEKYAAANEIDAFNREDFFVLTAAHVASMAGTRRDGLECVFPPSSNNDFKKEKAVSVQAEIFSVHERLDLALLRVVSSPSSVSPLLSSRGLELPQKRNEKMKETQRVRAFGYPMAYANPFFSLVGDSEQSNGEIIGYSEDCTHIAHTATVSSGCSGGPLLDDDGYVLGVHSFGDKFYGGEADVAACCFEIDLIDMLNKPAQSPSDWDTSTINEKIMKSSLKAMREIFPDIPEKEAKKWIL